MAMLYPDLFKSLESVRWSMEKDVPWQEFQALEAFRRAGAHHQDERHHRVVGAAGHRDVPARQPSRLGLLRLHQRVVLRGTEALARAHGVLAALPPRAGADQRGAARGALRVRSGAGAGDADPALLRRDPPQPLVPARRGVAHRAGDQAHLPAAVAGRGAPRRRLPALHEEVHVGHGRHGTRRLRQDRRAHGIGAAYRAGAAPDQPARQREAVPARHHPVAPAGSRLARALARPADQVRRRMGTQGRRAHPAQHEPAVRAHLRHRAGPQPLSQGSHRAACRRRWRQSSLRP